MSPQRHTDDTTEPAVGGGEQPAGAGPEATFDLGQSLLQAAIEEVRTPGGGAGPAAPGAAAPKARTSRRRRTPRRLPVDAPTAPSGHRGDAPGEETTVSDVPAVTPPDVVPLEADQPPSADRDDGRPRRRTLLVLGAVLVVFIVGAALLVAVLGGGGSDDAASPPGAAAPSRVRVAFDPITMPDGTVVRREWVLRTGKSDRLVGTISFSNPTAAPLDTSYVEVIPKSLASSVDDIAFDPEPTVLEADPVVQYTLTVPAGEEITARYEIDVMVDGAPRARLDAWVDDWEAARARVRATTTTSTTAPPATVAAPPTTAASRPPPPELPPGTVSVRVVSLGGTGTFGFSGPGGSAALTTSGAPDGTGQAAAISVRPGVQTWSQVSSAPGWTLVGVSCSNGAGSSGPSATFDLPSGGTVVCTWTNRTP